MVSTPWGVRLRGPISCPVVHGHVPPPVSPRCVHLSKGSPLRLQMGRGPSSQSYQPTVTLRDPSMTSTTILVQRELTDIPNFINFMMRGKLIFMIFSYMCNSQIDQYSLIVVCQCSSLVFNLCGVCITVLTAVSKELRNFTSFSMFCNKYTKQIYWNHMIAEDFLAIPNKMYISYLSAEIQ